MRTKTMSGAALVLLLWGLTACGDAEEGPPSTEQSTQQGLAEQDGAEAPGLQQPEPDLEGIPDVVADVNGEEIDREEFVSAYEEQFQQLAMQAQVSGQPLDQDQLKRQIAESLVGTELLIQEADDRGLTASPGQVDGTLQKLAESNGMESGDQLVGALVEQGMAEDEVMAQLETQVRLDQLLAEEAGDIEPTEDELRELYDQSVAQQEQPAREGEETPQVPAFEEVAPQLEEQITAQKEGEAMQALVDSLREDAEITIHL